MREQRERERQQQAAQAFDQQYGNTTDGMVYGPALPPEMEAATSGNAQPPVAQLAERPEFTGDEMLAALKTTSRVALAGFLNYVTADGWDIDAEGSPAQAVHDLFRLAAGVTTFVWTERLSPDSNFLSSPPIDEGISPLTIELLNDQRNLQLQNTEDAAHELIADVIASAERDGVDLGNIEGKSAREVLEIYLHQVEAVFRGEVEQQNLDGGYWVIDDPGEVTGIFEHWRPVLLSFGVAPEINMNVMEWVEHNFINVDASDPRQVEAAVRAYLTTELAQGGYLPDDPDSLSISGLAALVNLMQGAQATQARQGIGWLYNEVEEIRQGNYPSGGYEFWETMAQLLPNQMAVSLHPEYPAASQQLTDVLINNNVMGGLNRAFAGQYEPPPDFTLLVLVGSVVLEPIDWIATGVEVIQDIARGDWGSAAINTGLAIMPFAAGWMDDALGLGLRYGADDLSLLRGGSISRPGREWQNPAPETFQSRLPPWFHSSEHMEWRKGERTLVINNHAVINYRYHGRNYMFPEGSELANKYPDGVNFDNDGFPVFDPYIKPHPETGELLVVRFPIKLEVGGKGRIQEYHLNNNRSDMVRAEMYFFQRGLNPGFKRNEPRTWLSNQLDGEWHHLQDGKTLMLIPLELNRTNVPHTGGGAIIDYRNEHKIID